MASLINPQKRQIPPITHAAAPRTLAQSPPPAAAPPPSTAPPPAPSAAAPAGSRRLPDVAAMDELCEGKDSPFPREEESRSEISASHRAEGMPYKLLSNFEAGQNYKLYPKSQELDYTRLHARYFNYQPLLASKTTIFGGAFVWGLAGACESRLSLSCGPWVVVVQDNAQKCRAISRHIRVFCSGVVPLVDLCLSIMDQTAGVCGGSLSIEDLYEAMLVNADQIDYMMNTKGWRVPKFSTQFILVDGRDGRIADLVLEGRSMVRTYKRVAGGGLGYAYARALQEDMLPFESTFPEVMLSMKRGFDEAVAWDPSSGGILTVHTFLWGHPDWELYSWDVL